MTYSIVACAVIGTDCAENTIFLLFTSRCLVTACCFDSVVLGLSEYVTKWYGPGRPLTPSSFLGPHILLSSLFWDTLIVCSAVKINKITDQITWITDHYLFSLHPLFWKYNSTLMRSPCCLCVCVSPPSTFKCSSQSSLNLVCMSWHLSPSQRRASCYLPSLCVCRCTPPILGRKRLVLSNGSVYTIPRQRIHATIEELLVTSFSMRSVSYQRRVCDCVTPYRC
jgi:hypothetical protein